jgi:hypothetical protein
LATAAAPIVPPAPVRFSTTIGCPSGPAKWSDTVRAMMSMALPAVTGTMTRSGFTGHVCADAPSALASTAAEAMNDRHMVLP